MDIVQLLLQTGAIDRSKLSDIEAALKKPDATPEKALVSVGVSPETILNAEGEYYGVPTRLLGDSKIDFDTLQLIPEESARHYHFVPLGVRDSVLEVGVTDPDNLEARDALTFISAKLGLPYKIFLITQLDFDSVLNQYRGLSGEVGKALDELQSDQDSKKEDQKQTLSIESEMIAETSSDAVIGDAPVTKIVATILRHASEQRASDIHVEPMLGQTRVRFRVDGVLYTNIMLPAKVHSAVVARIKVLSNMRLDEKRKPQDGRFSARVGGQKVDFRVSTFPTYYGEKVVMRILGTSAKQLRLETLGFSQRNLDLLRAAIKRPYGLVLISGPTGSGKSTTLSALLNEIDTEQQNVLSLEDPVEYTIPGVSQSQVRPEIGYTFANGLRTTLRQDPNVIMVGEIRDAETADLAVQAALTGHLVLSTIHTNNAVGIVPRLLDMKIEPYLIAPVLVLGMAQRLVRTLCPQGGMKMPVEGSLKMMLDKEFADMPPQFAGSIPKLTEVYRVHPTPECPSGTSGRTVVSECYEMTSELEHCILNNAPEEQMFAAVRKYGMLTMKEDAIIKSVEGTVPFEEVNTLGGEFELPEMDMQPMPISQGTPEVIDEEGSVSTSVGTQEETEIQV